MKKVLKIVLLAVTAVAAAHAILISIDFLYKHYGRRYIDAE